MKWWHSGRFRSVGFTVAVGLGLVVKVCSWVGSLPSPLHFPCRLPREAETQLIERVHRCSPSNPSHAPFPIRARSSGEMASLSKGETGGLESATPGFAGGLSAPGEGSELSACESSNSILSSLVTGKLPGSGDGSEPPLAFWEELRQSFPRSLENWGGGDERRAGYGSKVVGCLPSYRSPADHGRDK